MLFGVNDEFLHLRFAGVGEASHILRTYVSYQVYFVARSEADVRSGVSQVALIDFVMCSTLLLC